MVGRRNPESAPGAVRHVALRAVFLALSLALLVAVPVHAVSFEAERQLGARFALAARAELPLVTDPAVVGYVDRVGQKIVTQLDESFFQYHFGVIRDARLNAFAVPGGYIYINTGLLARVSNEDELAAVLGHEVAHVHAHHLARQQEATQLMSYTALLGSLLAVIQPAVGAVAAAASQAVQLQYRREFEQEADYLGVRYMRDAGYETRSALDFFKKLADEQRVTPTFVPPYLLSHPLTDERLNRLEAVLRTNQWSSEKRPAASLELARVQAIARARAEPPGDVIADYRRLVQENPNNASVRYLFGLVCLELGQYDTAQSALTEARDAGVSRAGLDLGRLALRRRDTMTARQLLRDGLESHGDDAAAWLALGKTLEALDEDAEAREAYRRAIEVAPSCEEAQYHLGQLAGRAGSPAEGYYHLATAHRLRGEYETALNQYRKAREHLPDKDPRRESVREWIAMLSDFLSVRQAPVEEEEDEEEE